MSITCQSYLHLAYVTRFPSEKPTDRSIYVAYLWGLSLRFSFVFVQRKCLKIRKEEQIKAIWNLSL